MSALDLQPGIQIQCSWCSVAEFTKEADKEKAASLFRRCGWSVVTTAEEIGTACPSCRREMSDAGEMESFE